MTRLWQTIPVSFKRRAFDIAGALVLLWLITHTNLTLWIAAWAMSGFNDSLKHMKTMQPAQATQSRPPQQQGVPVVPAQR